MIVDVVDVVGIVIVGESSYVRGTPLAGAMFPSFSVIHVSRSKRPRELFIASIAVVRHDHPLLLRRVMAFIDPVGRQGHRL